jgi:hypothetical protein
MEVDVLHVALNTQSSAMEISSFFLLPNFLGKRLTCYSIFGG